ncbi:hypothetical protein [Luteibacter sp. 3190]|uniref:hypothetical protein n=1 Tax=Luteibacter sp. 3190 TaxID=2817736 RepID=UPI002866BDC7|nr:hypothetical protein [Luteibacter sp. 3190]MDR6937346.1 hypothetical protein [Luteibacter sp. 3190]
MKELTVRPALVSWVSLGLSSIAVCFSAAAFIATQRADRTLHARGIVIDDAAGIPRVVIGAPVPGPTIDGKTGTRAGDLSGIVINGPDGTERGGYGTVDQGGEAVLTLDSANGKVEHFKVVSNAGSGASLFIVTGDARKALMLSTYSGEPRISELSDDGEVGTYEAKRAPASSTK